ncbi:MAG: hypothetical protein J6A85_06005 [Clostridia bacterium]|nr:hypothetical protein [Clostridia bacterium]
MKRSVLYALLALFCVFLVSCAMDPVMTHYDLETLEQNVVSVELISYENPNQKKFGSWVPDHSDKLVPVDLTKITVIKTLAEEDLQAFLLEFSNTTIMSTYYSYDSPAGECIRLNYENGDFMIAHNGGGYSGYIGEFNADGTVKEFIGSFDGRSAFLDLLEYFK